jgi:uncharacterized membrane protein
MLLVLAGLAIGASGGVAVRYQRKHRGDERFHLGSWIAFAVNFVVVVAVGRAVNPIVQSEELSGWWFVAAISVGLGTLAAIGFGKLANGTTTQRAHE